MGGDISAGGFSILTDARLHEGDTHLVTLTLDDLCAIAFTKVIHCRAEGLRQWIAGLRFLNLPRVVPRQGIA